MLKMCIRDRIMDAKSRLAEAVSQQMAPLWQNGRKPGKDLRARVCDRLKRSLKEGYRTVSYTHLDVYKRQEYGSAGILLRIGTNEKRGTACPGSPDL